MSARTALVIAGGLALAAAGCERKAGYAGLGPWRVDRTVLRDASGRCEPTDLPDGREGTWCFGQPGLRLGGQDASVDLYFAGTEPDAKVIEIQLQFRGCKDDILGSWVRKTFGAPSDERGHRAFFRGQGAYVVADLPESPGRCALRMLPLSEEREIARLRDEADAKARPAPPR